MLQIIAQFLKNILYPPSFH